MRRDIDETEIVGAPVNWFMHGQVMDRGVKVGSYVFLRLPFWSHHTHVDLSLDALVTRWWQEAVIFKKLGNRWSTHTLWVRTSDKQQSVISWLSILQSRMA